MFDLSETDFERLCDRSVRWAGGSWEEQADRFENMTPGKKAGDSFSFEWAFAHDAGESWAHVVLARWFLDSVGAKYEILWDIDQLCYWLLTNYQTATWREMGEREQQGG